MIQELLGASTSTLLAGERKSGGGGGGAVNLLSTTPSPSPLPPPTTTTTTTASSENLRCPRCDSSNTKFCYYNNYNLTQPRHFCKTCRRYWTKGGALRNVPIGGGCRKNKAIGLSNSAAKSTSTKMKTVAPELGRSPVLGSSFEVEQHDLPPPSQILWGSPQNTHLLALLRASQNQNPNPNLNPNPVSAMAVKEEGMNLLGSISQSHMLNEPLVSNLLSQRYDGGHGVGQVVPSLGLCSSFWSSSQQNNNGGFVLGEHQIQNGGSSIQELYHKLRLSSSSSHYCGENSSQVFLGNVAASNSNSSSISNNIIEPSSVAAAGEFGFWNNPTLSWPDLPTTNGAYP